MSKFFNVTLDKDVVLDDSVTNSSTGWTGQKILEEILNHRVTKFEQLDDVDVVNKQNKQVVVYSGDTNKFTTVDLEAIGEAVGISLRQLTKMGVTGTATTPQVIDIPINTLDFKVPKINILKYQLGDKNVIKIENSFSNGESNVFIPDDMVIFDGTVHLKSNFQFPLIYDKDIDANYQEYTSTFDTSLFKVINDLSIISHGNNKVLNVTAIPKDRLLIPIGDMNLSMASNIDYFNVTATGNLKIVCSADGGATWNTFNNNKWENINLTVEDVRTKGMDVSTFNSVSDLYWNLLISASKIRFAYLLQDTVSIDELKCQYDARGSWIEAKPTEYDVIYASNSLLQVKLYFNGDVKINY